MVSAACRTRSSTSAALSASSTSSKADWSRVIAYSVLCVFLVVHTETHAMTPFYVGGTPRRSAPTPPAGTQPTRGRSGNTYQVKVAVTRKRHTSLLQTEDAFCNLH